MTLVGSFSSHLPKNKARWELLLFAHYLKLKQRYFFLQSLLRTADQLKIKGLCEVSDSREAEEPEPPYKPFNVFGSEPIKTVSFENVLQPTSFKNAFVHSDLHFNQVFTNKIIFLGCGNFFKVRIFYSKTL